MRTAAGEIIVERRGELGELAEIAALSAAARAGHEAIAIGVEADELSVVVGDPDSETARGTMLGLAYTLAPVATSPLVDKFPIFDYSALVDGFNAGIAADAGAIAVGVLRAPDVQ